MNDDSISRKYAIAHLKKRLYETQLNNDTEYPYYEEIADSRIDVWMNEVPSVQSEQKRGNWIRLSKDLAQCSECKDYIDNTISCGYNYCPNCGADMRTVGDCLEIIEKLPSVQSERKKTALSVHVKVDFDDMKALFKDMENLQTYKFEGDDMILVNLDDIKGVLEKHIIAEEVR